MSKMQEWLIQAASRLGLAVTAPHTLTLPSGHQIQVNAYFPTLGMSPGMLVVDELNRVRDVLSELEDLGYGVSVLSEPGAQEQFDLTSYIEMFRDWGWTGEIARSPEAP